MEVTGRYQIVMMPSCRVGRGDVVDDAGRRAAARIVVVVVVVVQISPLC